MAYYIIGIPLKVLGILNKLPDIWIMDWFSNSGQFPSISWMSLLSTNQNGWQIWSKPWIGTVTTKSNKENEKKTDMYIETKLAFLHEKRK